MIDRLTRRFRAIIRVADKFEAEVFCGCTDRQPSAPVKTPGAEECLELGVPMLPAGQSVSQRSSLQTWTGRIPTRVNFAYASLPVDGHMHRGHTRKSLPFASDDSSTQEFPLRVLAKAATAPRSLAPDVMSWRRTVGPGSGPQAPPPDEVPEPPSAPKTIVSSHSKRRPWDDWPNHSVAYVNPYYVQPMDNYLWLPMNPFGVLDIDESVDMHRSLTSEQGAGHLGVWLTDNPTLNVFPSTNSLAQTSGTNRTIRRELHGDETVDLPPDIASRGKQERVVDIAEGVKLTVGRGGTVRLRAIAAIQRAEDVTMRPKVYLEIDASEPITPAGGSRISARDAVLGEVIVEEQIATEERLRREREEERSRSSRLWRWTRG